MECTLQIDERLLAEAREAAGTADVHRLVEMGLRELVRQRRLTSLVDSFGTVDLAMSGEDLHRVRAQTSLVSSSMSASRSSTGSSGPSDAGGRYLIDTSIWIPVLRPGRLSQELGPRLAALVTGGAVTTDVVVMELLRGARNVPDYQRLEAQLAALPLLPVTTERWREAARLGFDLLRQHGLVVATPDLLIAAVAIAHRVTIVHRDADFDLVAQHTPLHVESHL